MEQPSSVGAGPKKTVRVWILQLICAVQIARSGYTCVTALMTEGVLEDPELPMALAEVALTIVLALATLLSAQRWAPRPSLTAPIAAGLWWLDGVFFFVGQQLGHERTSSKELAGGVVAYALMAFLAGSLFAHRKTRDYLAGVASQVPAAARGGESNPVA